MGKYQTPCVCVVKLFFYAVPHGPERSLDEKNICSTNRERYYIAPKAPSSVRTPLPPSRQVALHPVDPEAELRLLQPRKVVLHRRGWQASRIPSDIARGVPLRHMSFQCLEFVVPTWRALTRYVVGKVRFQATRRCQL